METKCKYFDYGKTAPKEYGAYCTAYLLESQPITAADCVGCKKFKPLTSNFEDFLLGRKLIEPGKVYTSAEVIAIVHTAFLAGQHSKEDIV